jgi:hypothetical protein
MVKSSAKQTTGGGDSKKEEPIVENKTNEGTQLGLNTGQRYVSKDGYIQIETPGSDGTPDEVTPGNSGSKGFQDAFAKARKDGKSEFEYGGKPYTTELSKDPNFGKDKVKKGKPATPSTYEHIPSSTEGTEGTPGKPAVKEKKGDSFNAFQQRNVNRKGLNLNRISKKGGKKELREEKKQAKAGLRKANDANFFQRLVGKKGKDYRQGVKDFNKGKFDSKALSKKGVSDFGYNADEATKAKKVSLGGGFDLTAYNKAASDHAMKQTSQGIRGKTAGEHIASGTTGANRVTTQEFQPAVASTPGTSSTNSDRTVDNKKNRETYGIPKRKGYKQNSPTSVAMKKFCL